MDFLSLIADRTLACVVASISLRKRGVWLDEGFQDRVTLLSTRIFIILFVDDIV
jgi:hypothetical protein